MPRNRKIFNGRTIRQWSGGELSFKKPDIRLEKLIAARINQGMITSIDKADLPLEALQLAKNAKVLFDKTSKRDGLVEFGPAAPDTNTVLKMASVKHPSGSGHTYRFTPSSIFDLQGAAWIPVIETVPLAGTVSDRIKVANVFDIIAFTNNGANNVQWINSGTDVSDDLIDNLSPELTGSDFRYCTGFFNRIVMGALRGENEILLAWTGEFGSKNTTKHGLEDLDPVVNETSGFSPLIDSPSDTSDFIKGVFGISSVLIILREKSIWLATKQPSAINPFNAYAAVPGVGCDSPYSAKITNYGLAWLDRRTKTVYHYTPGSTPDPIGRPIENSLLKNITDPDIVFAIYDPLDDAYSICIPSVASLIVQVWTFYFKNKAWVYNEFENLSSFDETELLTGSISIDDLIGTMDELTGTFDDLSPVVESTSERIYGFSDGGLAIPSSSAADDRGVSFLTDLISKSFMLPSSDTYVAMVVVEYVAKIAGTISIWYNADDGADSPIAHAFIHGVSDQPTVLNKRRVLTFRKVVHSRTFAFAIRSTEGQFDILGYEVWVTPSGEVSMSTQLNS